MRIGETSNGKFGIFGSRGKCLFASSRLPEVVKEYCRRYGLSKADEARILKDLQDRRSKR